MKTANINFWKKYLRVLSLGLSVLVLGYLAQTTNLSMVSGESETGTDVNCTVGQNLGTKTVCAGQDNKQECSVDVTAKDIYCQSKESNPYNCQYKYGKCGYFGSTTPSQPSQPAQPSQPTTNFCNPPDFGDPNNKTQWCSRAATCGDIGSLMRGPALDGSSGSCPQAPRNATNPTQLAQTCDQLGKDYGYCSTQRTYDTCTLKYDGNRAYYDCFASQNTNCKGIIYCAAKNRTTVTTEPTQPQQVVHCPTGTVPQAGTQNQNTIVCVAQNNNQNTTQNNNQAQSNNQNVSVSSSSSATGGSANVTVTGGGTTEVIREVQVITAAGGGNVGVGTSATGEVLAVKELPKTGLPALAWSALAFVPAGFKLRRFSKVKEDAAKSPNFLWEDRQFKVGA